MGVWDLLSGDLGNTPIPHAPKAHSSKYLLNVANQAKTYPSAYESYRYDAAYADEPTHEQQYIQNTQGTFSLTQDLSKYALRQYCRWCIKPRQQFIHHNQQTHLSRFINESLFDLFFKFFRYRHGFVFRLFKISRQHTPADFVFSQLFRYPLAGLLAFNVRR